MSKKEYQPYKPQETEDALYQLWLDSGLFDPDVCIQKGVTDPDAEPFTIVLPPPNVTGTLHTGHSLMLAIEDALIRFHRMRGKRTLWVPGTDHAAIATQSKVEKIIKKKEKKSRHDLGREEFLKRVDSFAQESHDTIVNQLHKLGSSLDWSREAFTLDEARNTAVQVAFRRMHDAGLIYRGQRIVNWDPKGQTTVSDDEVVHKETKSTLYTFRYAADFPISIASTRPETKVGDTAVAVHPDDDRYKEFIGKEFSVDFAGVPITVRVVGDPEVDPEFGTGALGVTPAHSAIDWEIAQRHNLPSVQVINEYARMMVEAPHLKDTKVTEAREIVIQWLKENDLLVAEEEIEQSVPTAERSGGVIEPLPKRQWWIDVNKPFSFPTDSIDGVSEGQDISLKELMQQVVRSGQIEILPKRFEKNYFHWIDNLRDWCISRQIWYGHQMPVWYDKDGNEHLPQEKTVLFARHGESESNAAGLIAGCFDSPLTDNGREQARALAQSLKDKNITRIISSSLSRTIETADIIGEILGCSVEQWSELDEVNYGDLTGTPRLPDAGSFERAVEKGVVEPLDQVEARAKEAIRKLVEIDEEGTTLVVGSRTFTSLLFAVWDGVGPEEFVECRRRWNMGNTEVRERVVVTPPTGEGLEQDPDTLDTWFSSGLWTFSTLGWPQQTDDLERYHPTTVLETGYDILFFWIARMILMTGFLLGDVPFKTVYLHGLVRDEQNRKMSKSVGNIVNPLDLIDQYGADALRLAFIFGTAVGSDQALSNSKVKGMRNFANKVYNIARFIDMNVTGHDVSRDEPVGLTEEDRALLKRSDEVTSTVTASIEKYRLSDALQETYDFVWNDFASGYLESVKDRLLEEGEDANAVRWTLLAVFLTQLKLLHPFMPFVTEQLYQQCKETSQEWCEAEFLMVSPWPKS